MGGGLMQLVAYGAQDVYLTGNPQITFFKVVYRRHTNFACEAIEQTFNGTVSFGSKAVCPITRNGDLVTKMWLHTTLTETEGVTTELVPDVGNALIKSVELQIGGTKIDKHYGTWMHVWGQLSRSNNLDDAHNAMVGNADVSTGMTLTSTNSSVELFVPLQFFFCRNDGLALPLIALQYHDVRLEFEFESMSNLYNEAADISANAVGALSLSDSTLLVNYIYLDSEERKRFAQASHEYLIEQLQFTGEESGSSGSNSFRLNFNHPVKELVWVSKNSDNFFGDYSTSTDDENPTNTGLLQLNGHDRFSVQTGKFFNSVQPHMCHSRAPQTGINVYSFALNPEEHQPSGTCNFSRIDNATLKLDLAEAADVWVFAVNYNVLRIMSGMGGVAYSN
tara:strand:- start:1600 stop:2775 length:1176 start_codon:yes stop_codon:yes gene_type:complete